MLSEINKTKKQCLLRETETIPSVILFFHVKSVAEFVLLLFIAFGIGERRLHLFCLFCFWFRSFFWFIAGTGFLLMLALSLILSLSLSFGPKEWLLLLSDCILLWFGSLSRSLAAGSYVWKTENRKQKTGEKKHASLSLARALAKLQRKMARVPLIF